MTGRNDLIVRPGVRLRLDLRDALGELPLELPADLGLELGAALVEELALPLRATRLLAGALVLGLPLEPSQLLLSLPQGGGRLVPLGDQLLLAHGAPGRAAAPAHRTADARLGLLEASLNGLERAGGALALTLQILLQCQDLGGSVLLGLATGGVDRPLGVLVLLTLAHPGDFIP